MGDLYVIDFGGDADDRARREAERAAQRAQIRSRYAQRVIELDLEPTGDVAQRLVRTGDDGELITEPVEIRRGQVIAEGVDTDCGTRRVEHLAFIVDAIRDHITGESCAHPGAHRFCPHCGARILAE